MASNTENLFDSSTLQANWYEDRFFDADSRKDKVELRVRPQNDEIENIPRITRKEFITGTVFNYQNNETPAEHWETVSMETYVPHKIVDDSVTTRRMKTSPEQLAKILDCEPDVYLPDYSLPERPPAKQYLTTYNKAFIRYI